MVRRLPRVVVYDPCIDETDAWADGAAAWGTRVQMCGLASDVVRTLFAEEGDTALVVRCAPGEPESGRDALLLMQVARVRIPAVPIVVLTSEPEEARAMLLAEGVSAEVLRAPATLSDVLVRLGGWR